MVLRHRRTLRAPTFGFELDILLQGQQSAFVLARERSLDGGEG
jgi:hypothetical protein